jgi:hypothetical protein
LLDARVAWHEGIQRRIESFDATDGRAGLRVGAGRPNRQHGDT